MSRMFGSARCDCAIFFPFRLSQLVAIAGLEKNRAVAHAFVKDHLTGRELQAWLVTGLAMRTDSGSAWIASA